MVKISGPDIVVAYRKKISGVNEEGVYNWMRESLREDIEKAYGVVGIRFVIGPAVYFFCSPNDAKKVGASNSSAAPLADHFVMWLYKQKNRKKYYTEVRV